MDQVEQDLLLSQAICEIANNPLLKDELAIRGGTALQKLFLAEAHRYSEDLDYVRINSNGIGTLMKELTRLGNSLGYSVSTKMGMYPKVYWRYISDSGFNSKIKIEINTYERYPVCGYRYMKYSVNSDFYSSTTNIRTYYIEELAATKLRALYQRSKGRDLYDLWIMLTELNADPKEIIKIYKAYQPDGVNAKNMAENLKGKLNNTDYISDVNNLIRRDSPHYDSLKAGKIIIEELISKIEDQIIT